MAILIGASSDGRFGIELTEDDHEHWDDGFDCCGTCGVYLGAEGE